jgi:hypothetical protein
MQGQLHAAWQAYQDAIALGTGPENVPFVAVGLASAYQADLLRDKYHVSNILSKLQVRNRTQAVARARSLGLLSAEP